MEDNVKHTIPTLRFLNKRMYLGGLATMPLLIMVGIVFFFFGISIILKIQYINLLIIPMLIYYIRKYARLQRNSKDDLIDTYFIYSAQPKWLEDNTYTMLKLKGKKQK